MRDRWIIKELLNSINFNYIVHLCGQRRTGKTTLFLRLNEILSMSEYILIDKNTDMIELAEYIYPNLIIKYF